MLTDHLLATGRHPSINDEHDLYGPFVGSWDVENRWYDEAADAWRENRREMHMARVLDGRAIQDVWGSREEGLGTTLRVFESDGTWRVVFLAPHTGTYVHLRGRREGDRIVQDGLQEDGLWARWTFEDVRPDAFTWRGEVSADGVAWDFEQEMHLVRR